MLIRRIFKNDCSFELRRSMDESQRFELSQRATRRGSLICSTVLLTSISGVMADQSFWSNKGTDYSDSRSWQKFTPGEKDVAVFKVPAKNSPWLTQSSVSAGLLFSGAETFGYQFTGEKEPTLTLLGIHPTGVSLEGEGGTHPENAAALRAENTSGTNQIDVHLILGAERSAIQTIYQEKGGTLDLNGGLSSLHELTALELTGGGTINLNAVSSFRFGITLTGEGTTLGIGDDQALGRGTLMLDAPGTLTAVGGERTVANAVTFAANTLLTGKHRLTFSGDVTLSGAGPRTLTLDEGASADFTGANLFLSDSPDFAGALQIIGPGSASIAGRISDFGGKSEGGSVTYGGTGLLTVTEESTYRGPTTVVGGTLEIGGKSGALTGTSAVVIQGGTLLLSSAATDRFRDDTPVTLGNATATSTLRLSGELSETMGTLTLSGSPKESLRVIDFGSSASVLTFSSLASETKGLSLEIWNWTSGGGNQLNLGSGKLGANASLSDITFYTSSGSGPLGSATFSGNSLVPEIVITPVPEIGALCGTLALLAPLAWRERRHWHRCPAARASETFRDGRVRNQCSLHNQRTWNCLTHPR